MYTSYFTIIQNAALEICTSFFILMTYSQCVTMAYSSALPEIYYDKSFDVVEQDCKRVKNTRYQQSAVDHTVFSSGRQSTSDSNESLFSVRGENVFYIENSTGDSKKKFQESQDSLNGKEDDDSLQSRALLQISGSSIPGIIEHLLIRPLPESEKSLPSHMTISILYPSIGRNDVDSDIRKWVTEIADSFQSNFDYDELSKEFDSSDGVPPEGVDLHADFRVSRPSSKALSITFKLWNTVGSGHTNLDVITLNYSLINGQRLSLADIFGRPDEALKLMSNWSRETLTRRYGQGRTQMLKRGTEALIENFSSLSLTPQGISIYFQPYQVAAWEMGIQTVDMPLDALRSAQPCLIFWDR